MIDKRLMPMIVGLAVLAGCAGGPQVKAVTSTAKVGEQVLTDADLAIAAKQDEKAYAMLKAAGEAHPVDKRPWVRMAQIRFNGGAYGEAITNAQEALARDPDDTLAHSLVAVSGLRVASKALSDLTRKNNLNGDVKSEAQDLARLLRTSLGESDLVPKREAARPAPAKMKTATASTAPAAPKPASNDKDPFSGLK